MKTMQVDCQLFTYTLCMTFLSYILPFGKSDSLQLAEKDSSKCQHVCGTMHEHHYDFKAVAVGISTLIAHLSYHILLCMMKPV